MFLRLISKVTSSFNQLTLRHLEWIFRVATKSPVKVFAISLLMLVMSGIIIARTSFESDIFRIFPKNLPALQLLLESLDWTGGSKEAYFLLEGDKDQLPVEAEKLVNRLQKIQLDGQPAFSRVTWRVYDESEGKLFTDFIAYAAARPQLFVSPQDAALLSDKLSKTSSVASVERMKTDLSGQFGGTTTALVTADPLYIRELILPRLKAASQSLDLDNNSPYFLSRNGRVLIVIAEPSRPVQDMEFARRLVVGINEARRGLTVSVSCAGAHMSAVLDEAEMKSNIISCILSSLVVVLLIFYWVYRRLLPTILLPLIISVGVAIALAVASLMLPSVHIISFAFMALIIGLGTDYSVHLYDRYHCERAAGKGLQESLHLAVVDTGHGLFTAATTTALPFLALMVSDVRALYELGLLVGLGVVFSLYTTLFFLPPLLIYMEKQFPAPFLPIPALGMGWVWRLVKGSPRKIIFVSAVLFICGLVAAFWITFDGELKNLQPRHSEAFMAQEKIEKNLSLAPKQLLIAVDGSELDDLIKRMGSVSRLAERYRLDGRINGWSSLGQVINDRTEQLEIVSSLKRSGSLNGSEAALKTALEKAGFEVAPFMPFISAMSHFNSGETVAEAEGIAQLAASPLRGVVNRHLIRDANGYHALIYLHYHDEKFALPAFLVELYKVEPTARVTGVDLVSSQLADSVASSFVWSFLLGGLLVLFLMVTHFKSRMGMFYALFPVAGGTVLMIGSMAVCGMGINFMNAMVLVTIVGMGSDYGLHIAHRVNSAGQADSEERFIQAGRAVAISALTTIAGFGSLAFADYPALASIGWGTNLGIGFTALFALVTLPAVILYMGKNSPDRV